MTETNKKLPEPVPVDSKKLIDGLGTIFGGVIQLLAAMKPGMAKELADWRSTVCRRRKHRKILIRTILRRALPLMMCRGRLRSSQRKRQNPRKPKSRSLPPLLPPMTSPRSSCKNKQNRSNSEKIGSILKTYGAVKVSELSADQYEAFLTDVSQL